MRRGHYPLAHQAWHATTGDISELAVAPPRAKQTRRVNAHLEEAALRVGEVGDLPREAEVSPRGEWAIIDLATLPCTHQKAINK